MNTTINFAEMIETCAQPLQIPQGELHAWQDCASCRYSEWNPAQDCYWCRRWKEHPVAQGCSFGVEDEYKED